jgi:hypothetical protein
LREIDPANPNLTYFSDPNSAPSQAALDRLNAAVEAAAIKRVADKAMTSGVPIGAARSSPDISLLPGGTEAAGELFDYLRVGTAPYESDSNKTILKLPRSAGYLTFRRLSRGGGSAIDVNVPGIALKRIHFP